MRRTYFARVERSDLGGVTLHVLQDEPTSDLRRGDEFVTVRTKVDLFTGPPVRRPS